ncbi:hypothetical protein DFA_01851 [Cavenderia fasciculata]|uniref:O-methyltransferase domain-containing protein n=1 Tax=Cavenderia fasciculata TaxID=261658 RepID=F4PV57_CACFS|nr:uncharacterized protein DFA_01851 [Cavenderia fasciculata]EGG21965.1 hypothetical protein DFA_01851 [Cavenderia fasciculata]|eukprot:XP_004359816.1 hypothetical protein DFA_01851 [Cavenderia fasciculata]
MEMEMIRMQTTIPNSNINPENLIQSIFDIVNGYRKCKVLYAAAELNISKFIPPNGKIHVSQLANQMNVNQDKLYRLMRSLTNVGVFKEVDGESPDTNVDMVESSGVFSHSQLSMIIKDDSIRDVIRMLGGSSQMNAWNSIVDTVKTGKLDLQSSIGYQSYWDLLENEPTEREIFDRSMTTFTKKMGGPILSHCDFSHFDTIVDCGGGEGWLIEEILKKNNIIKNGINFDLDAVIKTKKTNTCQDSRFKDVAGSFFESVPEADLYIFKNVLHNWNESSIVEILQTVSKSIKPNGKIYILDILPERNLKNEKTSLAVWHDMHMMMICDGKERDGCDYEKICIQTDFKVEKVNTISKTFGFSIGQIILSKVSNL